MRTDGVHCPESAGTGPVNLEVVSSKRVLPCQVTIDQLTCASLSHTHYHGELNREKCVSLSPLLFSHITLTDPLRIQPWSQDRRNQTKSNRESEISMESRQKRTDKEVASKGHGRDKIENINKNTQTVEKKLEATA